MATSANPLASSAKTEPKTYRWSSPTAFANEIKAQHGDTVLNGKKVKEWDNIDLFRHYVEKYPEYLEEIQTSVPRKAPVKQMHPQPYKSIGESLSALGSMAREHPIDTMLMRGKTKDELNELMRFRTLDSAIDALEKRKEAGVAKGDTGLGTREAEFFRSTGESLQNMISDPQNALMAASFSIPYLRFLGGPVTLAGGVEDVRKSGVKGVGDFAATFGDAAKGINYGLSRTGEFDRAPSVAETGLPGVGKIGSDEGEISQTGDIAAAPQRSIEQIQNVLQGTGKIIGGATQTASKEGTEPYKKLAEKIEEKYKQTGKLPDIIEKRIQMAKDAGVPIPEDLQRKIEIARNLKRQQKAKAVGKSVGGAVGAIVGGKLGGLGGYFGGRKAGEATGKIVGAGLERGISAIVSAAPKALKNSALSAFQDFMAEPRFGAQLPELGSEEGQPFFAKTMRKAASATKPVGAGAAGEVVPGIREKETSLGPEFEKLRGEQDQPFRPIEAPPSSEQISQEISLREKLNAKYGEQYTQRVIDSMDKGNYAPESRIQLLEKLASEEKTSNAVKTAADIKAGKPPVAYDSRRFQTKLRELNSLYRGTKGGKFSEGGFDEPGKGFSEKEYKRALDDAYANIPKLMGPEGEKMVQALQTGAKAGNWTSEETLRQMAQWFNNLRRNAIGEKAKASRKRQQSSGQGTP